MAERRYRIHKEIDPDGASEWAVEIYDHAGAWLGGCCFASFADALASYNNTTRGARDG